MIACCLHSIGKDYKRQILLGVLDPDPLSLPQQQENAPRYLLRYPLRLLQYLNNHAFFSQMPIERRILGLALL